MRDEEFIVIYGRPGNMKTWLACAMAAHAYMLGSRVMIFSKEISREAMLTRVCSVLGGVDYDRLRRGKLTESAAEDFFDLMQTLISTEETDAPTSGHQRALLFLSDKGKKSGSTVEDLIAAAERFQPDLIVVDGFYLMRDGRSGQRTADWKQISHISQDLKGMAQYVGCPVIGTTQANRANAKEPSGDLDDLSFADGIGQDADIAFRAFRGPNPSGRGASLLLVFSKSREVVIPPFIINADPGSDFSVQQTNANVKQFLEIKKQMEMSETAEEAGSPASGGEPEKKKKPKKRDDPFRS
jgi:replicative DNA helicase